MKSSRNIIRKEKDGCATVIGKHESDPLPTYILFLGLRTQLTTHTDYTYISYAKITLRLKLSHLGYMHIL